MDNAEKFDIERLIDRYGLAHVLDEIAAICGEKASHLAVNWQDTTAGKHWIKCGAAIERVAVKVR